MILLWKTIRGVRIVSTIIVIERIILNRKNNMHEVEVKEYYDTEKKQLKRVFFLNCSREKEGEYKQWYMDGQLWEHSFYKHNVLDGESKRWHPNGRLWQHWIFKNGQAEGECKCWYENGQLGELIFYKDGRREGEEKGWTGDGRPQKSCYNKHGMVYSKEGYEKICDKEEEKKIMAKNW